MILKTVRIGLILISFIFLTGFLPIFSLLGPGITIASSGNAYKAGAQYIFDYGIKKKTGKNSLTFFKEEVIKQNDKKDLNHKLNQELKDLVEKRIKIVRKKLDLKKINQ